ncbi:MAG: hypothetical protein WCI72_02030 [archaeon]
MSPELPRKLDSPQVDLPLLICGVTCLRARKINDHPSKAVPCYVGTAGGIDVTHGSTCAYNFVEGQIDSGQQYTAGEKPNLESTLPSSPSQPKCTDESERKVSFPHVDPTSPGYHPFKKGGDNPNPFIKY